MAADEPAPVTVHNENGPSPFLIVADHAGNFMPRALGRLGLPESECKAHIAWDIGIAAVSLAVVGLVLVVAIGLAFQIDTIDRGFSVRIVALTAIAMAGIAAAVFIAPLIIRELLPWWPWLQRPYNLLESLRLTMLSSAGAVGVALSCGIHALTASAVLLSAHAFGIALDPFPAS